MNIDNQKQENTICLYLLNNIFKSVDEFRNLKGCILLSNNGNSNNQNKKINVKIQNIVYQIKLHNPFDLTMILNKFEDIDKIRSDFPGLKVKIDNPRCTILFFVNGVIHVTGLKKTKDISNVERLIKRKLELIGIEYPADINPIIINSLAVGLYPNRLNLNKISLNWENIIYEPEVFPGLVYRIYTPLKVTLILFSSGKFLILGLRDFTQIPYVVKEHLKLAEFIE